MTPRENMLRTLRCDNPEWIPIITYVDVFNHPAPDSLPEPLAGMFRETIADWGKRWELFIPLSKYLGIDEYVLTPPAPFAVSYADGVEIMERTEDGISISVIRTRLGELEQRRRLNFTIKPYVTGPDDLDIFRAFVESWRYEPLPANIATIKRMKELSGDNGVTHLYTNGTPLGMMYRVYSDIQSIVYMMQDVPDKLNDLLGVMESQYQREFRLTWEAAPEVDVIVGMDDTSTTLVSPSMFAEYNNALTDRRVEIAESYNKIYLHHSCGLLKGLLPVYARTRMHGVHAFCRPPYGDVTYKEGRKMLGDRISIYSGIDGGYKPDRETLARAVRDACEDAVATGNITLGVHSPDPEHPVDYMEQVLEEARKYIRR